jgi:hypothetical protein
MMIKTSVLLLLLLSMLSPAYGQVPCDRWSHAASTGALPATEIVGAVVGSRIYLCGYVLSASGNPLDFQLISGTGTACANEQTELTPRIALASGGVLVNRIVAAAGEYTPIGHSLCVQTFGTGNLAATVYWLQRP